jgi:Mn2+/Fe2+ NRAMP family transporter
MAVKRLNVLAIIGPGILIAATGVGAGDLATGALVGSKLGMAILWSVLLGAGLKFVLNEGLARWQLATGDTLLEGAVKHFGLTVQYLFLVYLLFWSFFVGSALMSACGVAAHAIFPIFKTADQDKVFYGLLHSAVAVMLVRFGGYRLFEKVMSGCIAIMFVTTVATAIAIQPNWSIVAEGLVVPRIPDFAGEGVQWTVALMGGVGGTLTVLCYGYWIREEGRQGGDDDLKICRIDLAVGYTMTALFGIAMVIIGSTIEVEGRGAGLIVQLANQLESQLGDWGTLGRWAFLIGGWGAISSSLLGVWQSVPYLFTDFWYLLKSRGSDEPRNPVDTQSLPYRSYLYGLATVPALGLFVSFTQIQKVYAIFGASFMPILALALLLLNGRAKWVGERYRNSWLTTLILTATLVFFLVAGWFEITKGFTP